MCGCTERACSDAQDFGWRIGELAIKGPDSAAPHVSVFATEDIRLSLTGDFDDKFYLVLKQGTSCDTETLNSGWKLKGFAPIVGGEATWSGFEAGQGVVSVCLCHDTVAGLSDPFGKPHDPPYVCEKTANYAAKVGQVFVNGPLAEGALFQCRTGSICHIPIRWLALDSEDVRNQWTKSKVYAQTVSRQNPLANC